jgi:hypothetical protein
MIVERAEIPVKAGMEVESGQICPAAALGLGRGPCRVDKDTRIRCVQGLGRALLRRRVQRGAFRADLGL